MLGLKGSELKEAVSLSESVRTGLEEICSAKDEPWLRVATSRFEPNVGVSIKDAIASLRKLESAIEAADQKTLSDVNDLIDSIVDYLVVAIALMDGAPDHGGKAKWRLEHVRRDAGRLAQYICQMTEGTL
ncbi:MAG: hypothetical protein LUO79_02250 [Methanomassiliicoccales archaeon]|nr:hypothetical protein [Methanomassiliicoccales archaeon]